MSTRVTRRAGPNRLQGSSQTPDSVALRWGTRIRIAGNFLSAAAAPAAVAVIMSFGCLETYLIVTTGGLLLAPRG